MKKIVFSLLLLECQISFAQPSIPRNEIDSIFRKTCTASTDWIISLSIFPTAMIPLFDSLGNPLDEDAPQITFLLLKSGRDYYYQKIWDEYSNKIEPTIVISEQFKLTNELGINYTTDSIRQAEKEGIYQYIYKHDSLEIYFTQYPSSHERHYGMYFKTPKKDPIIQYFSETDLTEMYSFLNSKNLNYNYNHSTFIYRSFNRLNILYKKYKKSFKIK